MMRLAPWRKLNQFCGCASPVPRHGVAATLLHLAILQYAPATVWMGVRPYSSCPAGSTEIINIACGWCKTHMLAICRQPQRFPNSCCVTYTSSQCLCLRWCCSDHALVL